ncbi:MAG: ABC transporter substrate-binding protein [Chloroflexota bacterium]
MTEGARRGRNELRPTRTDLVRRTIAPPTPSAPNPSAPGRWGDVVALAAEARPDPRRRDHRADLAFARQLSAAGMTSSLVALVAAPIEHFRETLGSAADRFVGPSQWEPTATSPARRPDLGPTSADFVAAFRDRFGVEPDYPAAQAYAAGLVAAHTVTVAGTVEDAAVRAAAAMLDLTTFYGRFRLDPVSGRQVGHEMVVVQWQGGQKQVVWPPAEASAPLQLPTAAPTSRPFDADASS